LNINIVGLCDIDPMLDGFSQANEMGIFTTHNFRDLFLIDSLDFILDLTHDEQFHLELVRLCPKQVEVFGHNMGRLFQDLLPDEPFR